MCNIVTFILLCIIFLNFRRTKKVYWQKLNLNWSGCLMKVRIGMRKFIYLENENNKNGPRKMKTLYEEYSKDHLLKLNAVRPMPTYWISIAMAIFARISTQHGNQIKLPRLSIQTSGIRCSSKCKWWYCICRPSHQTFRLTVTK